jgi:hypothetical protein
MWDSTVLRNAVNATFIGQRATDGCMPDRVQADGVAVYSPGGNSPQAHFSDHAWDNGPFGALLLTSATDKLAKEGRAAQAAFFCDLEPKVGPRHGVWVVLSSVACFALPPIVHIPAHLPVG